MTNFEKARELMALDYRKCAEQIAANIGGGSNVISVAHCATRLRLVIADSWPSWAWASSRATP